MNPIDDVALPDFQRVFNERRALLVGVPMIMNTPIGLVLCIILVLVMRNAMARN